MKQVKCKVCRKLYTRSRPLQQVCSPLCAIELSKKKRDLLDRKEYREQKEKIKRRADWLREAQAAFNAWVRHRDRDLPCISCGRHHTGQYHAGHYRSVGSNPALRFEPLNVHKQCSVCNNHKSGNLIEYRINLLARIGERNLDWLEGPHDPMKYTIDDLRKIRDDYRLRLRQAKKYPENP